MPRVVELKCPITTNGLCRFGPDLLTPTFVKPEVFYAFDTATGLSEEFKLRSRAIRNEVELAVRECGLEPYAFDRDNAGSSTDWVCEKVCRRIQTAALVIADVSCYERGERYTTNPNVAFELGIAWGFRKPVMLVTGTPDKRPIADFRSFELFKFPEDFDRQRFRGNLKAFVEKTTFSPGLELISSKSFYASMLLEVETLPGDWLLAADYHSFLFRPLSHLKALAARNASDEVDAQRRQGIVEGRWRNFRAQLANTDNRFFHIFEWPGVLEYFSAGVERCKTSPTSAKVEKDCLLQEIDETISLLRQHHPKLQIAFTERSLPYAFLVRPERCVLIDSKSDLPNTLSALLATYRGVVEDMAGVFWEYWNQVSAETKSLNATLQNYERLRALALKASGG